MALLRSFGQKGELSRVPIVKPITTLGKASECDVVLQGEGVSAHHAKIVFDGRDFNLEEIDRVADISINNKKKRRARLVHDDRIQLGAAEIGFSMFSEASAGSSPSEDRGSDVEGLRKLLVFSEDLARTKNVNELLDHMMDHIVSVTHADSGFLLLVESLEGDARRFSVRVSRNLAKEGWTDAEGAVSDSIVKQVIETKRPLILSDALTDTQFGKSESVIALQLSSVMCAPLLADGEVMGVIYVGNNRIKHLFERHQLDLLSIFAGQASLLLQNAMLLTSLRADKEKLTQDLAASRFGEIIGSCASMVEVFRKLQKVAPTDISVLVTGETGTGKELIAREIHRASQRAKGPFVTINCGAIPENLIESELFGHVKGAFTGAVATRPGRFQSANGGTLFLDEIGELAPAMQVKLLRALQERIVTKVGDSKPEKVDIRVIAATHRNLEQEITTGGFREDLYYRLNVVNLFLPPLRERGDDILIIAKALLAKFAIEFSRPVQGFSAAAAVAIRRYPWPGNIRQLENRIKKGLVLCDEALLRPEDLDLGPESETPVLPLEKAKEEFQRRYVLEALERNGGNRTQTARELGVDPRTIFRYLEREGGRGDAEP